MKVYGGVQVVKGTRDRDYDHDLGVSFKGFHAIVG